MTRSHKPTYDLALSDADYEPWDGQPKRSIVICSHPRSGSTLLGEALYFSGDVGCPLEYLHRGFRPKLAEMWGCLSLEDYVAEMHRRRTGPNGNFAIKLFWQDIEELAHELAPDHFPAPLTCALDEVASDHYQSLAALLARIIPNPTFIHLERRDRVRQAVSASTATQTGLWRSIPGVGPEGTSGSADYDFDQIMATIALSDHCHSHWQRFFGANDISPISLTYENLVDDYDDVTSALLVQLGSITSKAPPHRMRRQSDHNSEAMVHQFLKDYAKRKSP
ncbi:Stf0 family sulfotransferase [Parasphingorhabdus sp.]|uniref:Stf0 family sulfotransferase n=1 Tax=Parasphingorhabdus sp. TaxID=2709688 RepID=UPI003A8C8D3E